jgi:hypothetical protein
MTNKLWIAGLAVVLTSCGGRYEYVDRGRTHYRIDLKTNEKCVWSGPVPDTVAADRDTTPSDEAIDLVKQLYGLEPGDTMPDSLKPFLRPPEADPGLWVVTPGRIMPCRDAREFR